MSVTTDRLVARWPHTSLRIAEMSIAGSFLAAILLVPTIWALNELPQWKEQLPAAMSGPLSTTATRAALIGCSIALPAAKALVRTAKYESIAAVSALGFEFVQAGATLAASLLNVMLFPSREPWSGWYLGAVALLCAAFAAYARARTKERAAVSLPERARAATAALALSSMSESPAPLTLTPMAGSHVNGAPAFSGHSGADEADKPSRRRPDALQLGSQRDRHDDAVEPRDTDSDTSKGHELSEEARRAGPSDSGVAIAVPVLVPQGQQGDAATASSASSSTGGSAARDATALAAQVPRPRESGAAAAEAQRGESTLRVTGDGWAEVPL